MTAIYLHIPFCKRRCLYCDFFTCAGKEYLIPEYVDALCEELGSQNQAACLEQGAGSVYFGGGTPSLLPVEAVLRIMREIQHKFTLLPGVEVTLEANPGTIDQPTLAGLRAAGVNRLSLGIQSFQEGDLRLLGRIHTSRQAIDAIEAARHAGFDNLSLDLIFGLPGQSLADWRENLERAAGLEPQHLSLYSLILEPGTALERQVSRGQLVLPDDDLAADMFELAMDCLPDLGFEQYEISNWAREERFESRHNKVYWQNGGYLGFGAGAHSSCGGYRFSNAASIEGYIHALKEPPREAGAIGSRAVEDITSIDRSTAMKETMMLGLRMTREGVSVEAFKARYQADLRVVFANEVRRLLKEGLVEWKERDGGTCLVLTHTGIMLGNQAFMEFV